MRPHPVNLTIWDRLQKLRQLEQRLAAVGVPAALARLPYWLFSIQYCWEMESKIIRIRRIGARIEAWHESMHRLCTRDGAEIELVDVGMGMRDDIEATKRTLADLRDICVDVTRLFDGVGYSSRRLMRLQENFVALLNQSYDTASALQSMLHEHDERALALLRELHGGSGA
ncbi:hypothetical protein GCM10027277_50860 [Pseudoduganella ginsengisoli]|uniref:Uncharacterized protein n=1 Tax=Pseudoduganella ginsengisoli TaxID=1462440 RepID=A0A6L6QA05_9BURK|nr:hypothetical protein [Pseudoduganella ginsengisoli]MTW06021.1 hypothetical protein [Pseudoduganella ginsengisoli]